MYRFSKKDKVVFNGRIGTVLDVVTDESGSFAYYLEMRTGGICRALEDSLVYYSDRLCECGAKHTEFPEQHLFYCQLYRRS